MLQIGCIQATEMILSQFLVTSSVKSGHQQSCPSLACPEEESFLATCSFSGFPLNWFIDASLRLTPPLPPLHGLYYGLIIKCRPQAHLLIIWEVMGILGYADPSSCLSCSPSLCFLSAMNILLYHILFLVGCFAQVSLNCLWHNAEG